MTTSTVDLAPAAAVLATLVRGVEDGHLDRPTPCEGWSVAALLDHVSGFANGLSRAAVKDLDAGSQAPGADASRLGADWRERIPAELDGLVKAWSDPAAWDGDTRAGGIDLPGSMAGLATVDELAVHGWDLAMATGQPYDADDETLGACERFLSIASPDAENGPFGPIHDVPVDAPALERVLGRSGRNPLWRPAA